LVRGELSKEEWEWEETHELPTNTILLVSEPPSGKHKVYNLYATKIDAKYHLVFEVETIPEI